MVTVKQVLSRMEELCPLNLKMDFDNVGLLVGWHEAQVTKILCALDVTSDTIKEAENMGAELIVSHHPVFFSLKKVTSDDLIGRDVLSLAQKGISAICMHTNLDVAKGGVNDALAAALGLCDVSVLSGEGDIGLGRIGAVNETALTDFLARVKDALGANGLRYVDGGKPVSRVAVVGGSGSSELMAAAAAGCDTMVTADVKYNGFIDARNMGVNLIDAGHYPTENVIVELMADYLRKGFPELIVEVSKTHSQPEQFF